MVVDVSIRSARFRGKNSVLAIAQRSQVRLPGSVADCQGLQFDLQQRRQEQIES
jgi:hypothetical protein